MGGSDDGSGTGQAANVAADHDPEDGSAAEGAEIAAAEAAVAATATGAKASPQEMTAISEENTASGDDDGSVNAQGTEGVPEPGSAPRKGGALSSPDQATADLAHDAEVAAPKPTAAPLALLPAADAVHSGGGDEDRNLLSTPAAPSQADSPAIGASCGAASPLPPDPHARDDSKGSEKLPNGAVRLSETAATEPPPGHRKDAAPGGSSEKGDKQSKDGRGRQTPEISGNESRATEDSSGHASSKDDGARGKATTLEKKQGGVEKLLDSTVSHTVDCLIYIRWYVSQGSSDAEP